MAHSYVKDYPIFFHQENNSITGRKGVELQEKELASDILNKYLSMEVVGHWLASEGG